MVGIFEKVGVLGVLGNGLIKNGEGFGLVIRFSKPGGEEAGDAEVFGKEGLRFSERGDGFFGAALLSKELAEEKEVVGSVELGSFDEGFGESGAEIRYRKVGAGSLDELLGGALGGGRSGVADPAAFEGRAGGAAVFEGGGGELGVGNDLIRRDGAPVDGEEFSVFRDEKAGRNGDGGPEIND